MLASLVCNDEAYLVAGGKVQLLAEQDVDYSFSEKKKKGSFGRKSFKSDERTQVTHVGSSITSGGDLAIISGDEQRYQAAQLSSGADLTLDSGAGIVFEGVKDLEQQSRIRSKNSWAWQSAKGKGNTDETLMQSQLQAQGEIAIRAAERIQIDIKEVNQQSISQTIDAMVQADPQLAWLKDMEQRGDVDWRQVKELHDSFKYSSSGLSGPAAMVIAIVVAYFTAGAASGLVAGAASTAGATTATAGGMWAAGTGASLAGAGWANIAVTSGLTSLAGNTLIGTINNKGDLGAGLKDATTSDALKGYAVSGITAGLTAGLYDNWTGTQTGASNTGAASGNTGILANSGKVAVEGGLSTWGGVGQFAANQALQNVTSATLNKVLGQDGDFGDALTSTLANTFAAAGFNWVGDFSQNNQLDNGSLAKIGLHAIMGGLAAEAAGGDFKSGALVAGANEALIDTLASQYDSMTHEQRSSLLTMNSQVLGVLVASMAGGDEKDMQTGAWVAGNATSYNHELHSKNADSFIEAILDACTTQPQRCAVDPDSVTYDDLMQTLEVMAAHGAGINDLNPNAVALVNQYYNNDLYRDRLEADLFQPTESEQSRLQMEQTAELIMAGAGLGAAAVKSGPGVVAWVKGVFGKRPEAIKFDGKFYSAGGVKIEKAYYERLWEQGRPAPFLQAKEILTSSPKVSPDPRGMPGYFRYEGAGLEMIYNPVTGQVGHIQPLRK